MQIYDVILTLGNGLTEDWKLPGIVASRLKKVADLYLQKIAGKIIVCGRWSINWDIEGIQPPTTEAEEMRKTLLSLGVANQDIIKEEWSRDTIGNAYFSKINIIEPNNFKKILVVCSDFHLQRAQFLFRKIIGSEYRMDFITTPTESSHDPKFMKMEEGVLQRQIKFLKDMKDGDDLYLKTRLYDDPYYQEKRSEKIARAAMGEIK
ncbi:MAG: hypothetical protein HW400_398 [Candidatus Levybacteria bacterium]|nr:hypothetical protein [Candidatus Levybacteria bacterium]